MIKKTLLFRKCAQSAYVVCLSVTLAHPVPSQAEEEVSFDWKSYLPEWLKNIAHQDFPEFQKEIQAIEQGFECVKPIPYEETSSLLIQKSGPLPAVCLYGPAELQNFSVKGDVRAHGPLRLRKTEFYVLHAEGPVDAKDAHISEGIVKGPAKLVASKVVGTFMIHGPFLARNSYFTGKIVVQGNKAVLLASKVEGDVIMTSTTPLAPQTLFLLEGTEIQGNVIFQEDHPQHRLIVDKKSSIHGVFKGATPLSPP